MESDACPHCDRLRELLSEKDQALDALRARIEALSRVDPLTGAYNRRSLIEMLDAELQRALRTGHPFCFAIMDLDHFKQANEQYGHSTGDALVKTVAETAIKLLRTVDRFGRLDGSKFGIVLPATWLDQGLIAMDRLSKAVGECVWEGAPSGMAVTFSAGITTNAPKDTAGSIAERAEQGLLQAQQEGGKRTVSIEQPLADFPPMDLA